MKKILFICFCFFIILTGYSQNENAIIEGGELILKPNIPSNPVAGSVCWTGTDFMGFNGVEWVSLTTAKTATSPIEIGNYLFQFPSEFSLVPGQGIDSYLGDIIGGDISLSFEYGPYAGSTNNLAASEYVKTVDETDGHYRKIIKPFDSENNFTEIYMYKISDYENSIDTIYNIDPAYNVDVENLPDTVYINNTCTIFTTNDVEFVISLDDTCAITLLEPIIAEDPFYNRLSVRVKNVTPAEQEMVINIFNNVKIVD